MTAFLHTPREKLEWLATREPDPRRSQLRKYVPNWIHDYTADALYWEKYQVMWYDEIAKDILDVLDEPEEDYNHYRKEQISLNNPDLLEMIDGMYYDVINNDKWGFIFDW